MGIPIHQWAKARQNRSESRLWRQTTGASEAKRWQAPGVGPGANPKKKKPSACRVRVIG
jgi:hypothetical protein